MILRRIGNKTKYSKDIQKLFPKHTIYIEPFFGAGGMFFNKPQAKFNIVNDLDEDVFNLFRILIDEKKEFEKMLIKMPIHKDLWEYYKINIPKTKIERALRFIFLSNFGFMGQPNTLIFGAENPKDIILKNIDETFEKMKNVQFDNCDAVDFIFKQTKRIISKGQIESCFIYCDPPYLGTDDNYSNSFTEKDVINLFDCLEKTKSKFAVSEFDHPFILEEAKRRGLVVNEILKRHNLKNKRTEILITNYQARHTLF